MNVIDVLKEKMNKHLSEIQENANSGANEQMCQNLEMETEFIKKTQNEKFWI